MTPQQDELAAARRTIPSMFFGGQRLPIDKMDAHTLVVGATGSGKTLMIRTWMQGALREQIGIDPPVYGSLRYRGLVYDAKRDMLPCLAGMGLDDSQIINLNPFDERGWAWDIAKDVTSPARAHHVATILFPIHEGTQNPFFQEAAQVLLRNAFIALHRKCEGKWTLSDVINALSCVEYAKHLLRQCEMTRMAEYQYLKTHERTVGDIIATLANRIAPLAIIASLWDKVPPERRISIRDWYQQSDPSVLVLGVDETIRTMMDAVNQVIFKLFADHALNLPEHAQDRGPIQQTWAFVDEVQQAGKLDGLTQLLTRGRSKGVHVVLGFQDIDGMHAVYKQPEADAIISQCGNTAMLRVNSAKTAKWMADLIGANEFVDTVENRGTTSGRGGGPGGSTWNESQQINYNQQIRITHPVLPVQFQRLAPPGARYGIQGYFLTPHLRWWGTTLNWDYTLEYLAAPRRPKDDNYSAFKPRSDNDQYLKPWDDARMHELGLPNLPVLENSGLPSPKHRTAGTPGRELQIPDNPPPRRGDLDDRP